MVFIPQKTIDRTQDEWYICNNTNNTDPGNVKNMAGYTRKRKHNFFGRFLLLILLVACVVGALWFKGKLDIGNLFEDEWYLTLVNNTHAIPDNWDIKFTELKNGEKVDSRIYPNLQEMFNACREAGLLPLVMSSYRTAEDQQAMLDEKKATFVAEGYSEQEALAQAKAVAAEPGYSEHQLGLAVDIDSEDTSVCSNEELWEWLRLNCADYGFILRYPSGKENITGISYEPWHFRYVGKDAAKKIMDSGITLEEYLKQGGKG